MSDTVNKVRTKDGSEYLINDSRVPEILAENAGKVLAVNEEGTAFEFKDAPSGGGTKLYKHSFSGIAYDIDHSTSSGVASIVLFSDKSTAFESLREVSLYNGFCVFKANLNTERCIECIKGTGGAPDAPRMYKLLVLGDSGVVAHFQTGEDPTFTDTVTEL